MQPGYLITGYTTGDMGPHIPFFSPKGYAMLLSELF